MNRRLRTTVVALAALTATAAGLAVPAATQAATSPLSDPFYRYTGTTPLAKIKPGTALKTRTIPYSIQGISLPLTAVQVLYRTRNQVGTPTVNVTTVVEPLGHTGAISKVVSYQSFYDSLNPADEPSAAIAGAQGMGDGAANVETTLFAPLLLAGYAVNIPDTEGQTADFAAGPEYGVNTLDSLRAISASGATKATGVAKTAKLAMLGYSGGAIASEWAAEQAATYAPDVAKRLVGTAIGGVFADPDHNLHYVQGSLVWAGVIPMALVGIARSFHIDLTPYMSAYGAKVMKQLENASIFSALGTYPGLTWAQLAKPKYATPESVPVFVKVANEMIMGTGGTPNAPMFIGQGTGGFLEGTSPSAQYGAGDGVMVAGDVRTLAREYCQRKVTVDYETYGLSHFTSVTQWLPAAYSWLLGRFAGTKAPSSCGSIPVGNSLAPVKPTK